MSKENPGVIFDASNRWNGYNHQGKLAILFAIKQILEVYDKSLSTEENKKILKDYFLEIEYLEDFSIGKQVNDGKEEYSYVHQVKNHATTEIDLEGEDLCDYIKKLISMPTELNKVLARIETARNDKEQKECLYFPY